MAPIPFARLVLAAGLATSFAAAAQTAAPAAADAPTDSWQACAATADGPGRLACFDRWALRQQAQPGVVAPPGVPAPTALGQGLGPPAGTVATAQVAGAENGCQDGRYSRLSRFWELERSTDCGTFELRGYRPITLAVVRADGVNEQPSSPAPGRTPDTAEDYRRTEARIQLSARVKVAKGLLTGGDPVRQDSLWVGYTQQSYWQFFSPGISRPFRTTDYEPEAMYIYPADYSLGPVRLRYAGAAVSHQSNGRTLPQSRSWNRAQLLAGLEIGKTFSLEGRLWSRFGETDNDDNPDIVSFLGRSELAGTWTPDNVNTVVLTARARSGRLEYFRALGRGNRAGGLNDLRLHIGLFSGYGDSLLDYNRKRNVLSIGLALVDW
jgi:phospholipase A1/A2